MHIPYIFSVDLGVLEHLMPMLDKADHDWGLLIAHFLGVDHAGHRYGPGHGNLSLSLSLRQLSYKTS